MIDFFNFTSEPVGHRCHEGQSILCSLLQYLFPFSFAHFKSGNLQRHQLIQYAATWHCWYDWELWKLKDTHTFNYMCVYLFIYSKGWRMASLEISQSRPYKVHREQTRALTKYTHPDTSTPLLTEPGGSQGAVYLAAHPNWAALWSHIK